jgi:hypothetical protein
MQQLRTGALRRFLPICARLSDAFPHHQRAMVNGPQTARLPREGPDDMIRSGIAEHAYPVVSGNYCPWCTFFPCRRARKVLEL